MESYSCFSGSWGNGAGTRLKNKHLMSLGNPVLGHPDYKEGSGVDMHKLSVKCIKCNKMWEKKSAVAWGPDDYSGSLCKTCFLKIISPKIHRKQLKEGNFPCFRSGALCCDQCNCKYRRWCLDTGEARRGENDKAA
jgi:hypothetical protein